MGLIHLIKSFALTIRESANDGSDFSNPDADYRVLFLGEDGNLYTKDSSGTVDSIGGGSGAPDDADYVTYSSEAGLSNERVVTTPASGGVIPLLVRKASNEIVNNSAVLQNDDELKFAVAASEVWAFIMQIWSQSNTTPDIKYDVVGPSGSTVNWSIRGEGTGAAVVPGSSTQTGGTPIGMLGNGDRRHAMIEGFIANGATPGDLQLQWAQNTQNGSDTTVFANSYIIAWRMA